MFRSYLPFNLLHLLTLVVGLVSSSGCKEPFHESAEGTQGMKELIIEQFGNGRRYGEVILFYDATVGNSVVVSVQNEERPMMMDNWVYLNTPVNVGRQPGKRSFGRVNVGSIGGWTKKYEKFIDSSTQKYLEVDEIRWNLIPKFYDIAEADMISRGVPDPQLQMVVFGKSSGKLTAIVITTTMGGGSSMTYEFDMDGNMVRPPA